MIMSLKLDQVVPLSDRTFWQVWVRSEIVSHTLKSSWNKKLQRIIRSFNLFVCLSTLKGAAIETEALQRLNGSFTLFPVMFRFERQETTVNTNTINSLLVGVRPALHIKRLICSHINQLYVDSSGYGCSFVRKEEKEKKKNGVGGGSD